MSPRIETGYEAGDADELVPHNEVPVSASQVKPGVVLRKSHPLPGETCAATSKDDLGPLLPANWSAPTVPAFLS